MGEGESGDGGDVFDGCTADSFDRAKGSKQESAAFGADSGDFIEDGAVHPFVAEFAVESDGEAVGFVAEFAKEHESGGSEREDDFAVTIDGESFFGCSDDSIRDEDDFLLFGESDHGKTEIECVAGFEGGTELTFSTIDHDEVGDIHEFWIAIEVAAEAPGNDFVHHGEVVGFFGVPLDFEASVFVFGCDSIFANDH